MSETTHRHVPHEKPQPDPLLREDEPVSPIFLTSVSVVVMLLVGLVIYALNQPSAEERQLAAGQGIVTGPSAPASPPGADSSAVDRAAGAGSPTPGVPPVAGDVSSATVNAPPPRPPLPPLRPGNSEQTTGQGGNGQPQQ